MSNVPRPALLIAMLALTLALTPAFAQRSQTERFAGDGAEVPVRFYPPQGDGPHPLLLIVPPGLQSAGDAGDVLRYFRDVVEDGWLVASPIAPEEFAYFHRGSERHIAPLIDALAGSFPLGEVHLIGVSTGAAGAVKAALLAPERYASLTLFPGAPEEDDEASLGTLGDLPVLLYVGASDDDLPRVEHAAAAFEAAGVPVDLTVVDGSGHRLPRELGPELARRLAELER